MYPEVNWIPLSILTSEATDIHAIVQQTPARIFVRKPNRPLPLVNLFEFLLNSSHAFSTQLSGGNDYSDGPESFYAVYRTLFETIQESETYATAPAGESPLSCDSYVPTVR